MWRGKGKKRGYSHGRKEKGLRVFFLFLLSPGPLSSVVSPRHVWGQLPSTCPVDNHPLHLLSSLYAFFSSTFCLLSYLYIVNSPFTF